MSDKELVMDLLRKLPQDASIQKISEEVALLAGIQEAEDESNRGEVIDHERIKEDLETWLSN